MAKKCTIYYAMVVISEFNWSRPNTHHIEPVGVEGREPLGKAPESCCDELMKSIEETRYLSLSANSLGVFNHSSHWGSNILGFNYCPFCGAKIVFKEHLKLKVIETPITRHQYHYEVF